MLCCMLGCDEVEVIEQPLQSQQGYIYFNTEVSTRGELVEELNEKSFGITAYNYTGEWSFVKVQANPNVFQSHGQEVTWDGGMHTYTPLVPWDASKKYAFFGYYPHGNSNVILSDKNVEGTPYIDFTLPNTLNAMVDVMTASLMDTDNSSSNAVGLTFKHRLTAMDVQARNFHEQGYSIRIKSLTMRFDSLLYNKVRLPLDDALEITRSSTNNWTKIQTYQLVSNSNPITIEPAGTTTGSAPAISITNNSSLIFIPQEADATGKFLRGNVSMTYDVIEGNRTNTKTFTTNFDVGKSLLAGRKYYFLINFSTTSVSIAIVDSGEWTDKNIEIEFE